MKIASALTVATAIAFTSGAAHARGDGGNEAQQKREKLLAELAVQRANGTDPCANASLWGMIFGHEEAVAGAESPATTAK